MRVVAAALVEQHRDLFGRAFAIADAEFEPVILLVVTRFLQRLEFRELLEHEDFLVDHQEFMAAAVDRGSGLQNDHTVAAGRVGMLDDLEPAHHADSVKPLVMLANILAKIELLVGEIAFDQQLAGEVVVPDKRPRLAFLAAALGAAAAPVTVKKVGHASLSLLTRLRATVRVEVVQFARSAG